MSTLLDRGNRGSKAVVLNEHATMVVWLISMAVIWHYTSSSVEIWEYWLHFDPVQTPATILVCLSATLVAFFPGRALLFTLLAFAEIAVISSRMPYVATHVLMAYFLFAGVILSWIWLRVTRQKATFGLPDIYQGFAPLGRWLLIVMYLFGTFHKINPVFLTPQSSCAIPYLQGLPLVSMIADKLWIQYAAIYGTLVLEFAAMLMLLVPRFKYYGMLLGVSFHFAIGISSYGSLAHFSSFAIALHAFFLPPESFRRFREDSRVPRLLKTHNALILYTSLTIFLEFYLARNGMWGMFNLLFAFYSLLFFCFVLVYGKQAQGASGPSLLSGNHAVNLLSVLFLVHCISPYIGLRTEGVVQMFSGLRTEGGISNHYIVTRPYYLADYLRHVVEVVDGSDDYFSYLKENNIGIVKVKFLRYLQDPETTVVLPFSVLVDGKLYQVRNAGELKYMFNEIYEAENAFERFYFNFRGYDLKPPEACRH